MKTRNELLLMGVNIRLEHLHIKAKRLFNEFNNEEHENFQDFRKTIIGLIDLEHEKDDLLILKRELKNESK